MDRKTEDMVAQAMRAWDQEIPDHPTKMDEATRKLRIQLLSEELAEFHVALLEGDLDECLKELCDMQYVLDGTFLAMGFGRIKQSAFEDVHESNMSKLVDGKPFKNEDGKVSKGPNYKPPMMKRYIES